MWRLKNCDALFLRQRPGPELAKPVSRAPAGWQRYREQLWENPKGQLKFNIASVKLSLCHGCILDHLRGADVLINSANKHLVGPARPDYWMFSSHQGHSVEEVVHAQAGPGLLSACQQINFCGGEGIRCPVGSARATPGTPSLLPDGFIVHAVAPGWHSAETSPPKLRAAWLAAMDLAISLDLRSMVAPSLGCGTNRTPYHDAAICALQAMQEWGSRNADVTMSLRVVLHDFEAWTTWTDVAYAFTNT